MPVKLVNKLKSLFYKIRDYRTRDNCLLIVGILYNKQLNEYGDIFTYVPTGRNYWREVIHSGYNVPMKLLIKAGVIEANAIFHYDHENPSPGKVRKYYRVSPQLLNCNEFTSIFYNKVRENGATGEYAETNDINGFTLEPFSGKKMRISTFSAKAIEYVENNTDRLVESHFDNQVVPSLPPDFKIRLRHYRDGKCFIDRLTTVQNARFWSEQNGEELFFFKGKFYGGNIDLFRKNRIVSARHYYTRSVLRLINTNELLVSRVSKKTGRIFNHLVNFPSDILQLVRINEKPTIQIDLKTSQILLFGNLLNAYIKSGSEPLLTNFPKKGANKFIKRLIHVLELYQDQLPFDSFNPEHTDRTKNRGSSVTLFLQEVFSGNFYEIIQKECNLYNRSIAKNAVFTAIFGQTVSDDDFLVMRLKDRYPVVMDIIKTFKAEYGYKEFPIGLQAVEAYIFIAKILKPLRNSGVPCFSRHDSIVVQFGYEDKAINHMERVFEQFEFIFNRTVEGLMWSGVDDAYEFMGEEGKDIKIEIDKETNQDSIIIMSDEEDSYTDLNSEQLDILYELEDIGILDDYSDSFTNAEHLHRVLLIPGLTNHQNEILEQEVVNLMSGHIKFQPETNIVLREIISQIQY